MMDTAEDLYLPICKTIGSTSYVHVSAWPKDARCAGLLSKAQSISGLASSDFNVIRVHHQGNRLGLLKYANFFEEAFPWLKDSWVVDVEQQVYTHRSYHSSLNPPILHRKELLLPQDHPDRQKFADLTAAAENIGLFDDPRRIGYQRQWYQLIKESGYRLDGYHLVPLANDEAPEADDPDKNELGWGASRHLTALVRYGFSAPVQSLARHGYLDGRFTLFDYGCGRGDDVRGLKENGIEAVGWDPYHAPDNSRLTADIVNLGFVINVIEDFDERVDALLNAWRLSNRLLVVSVMLANQNDVKGRRFEDGVLTQRGTFQKYYTQGEIKAFIERVLEEEAIPVAPGVLYVFRDKDEEQRFFIERFRTRRNRLQDPSAPASSEARCKLLSEKRYAEHQSLLEDLWECWLLLGRKPDKTEVPDHLAICEAFGSLGRALRFLLSHKDSKLLEQAEAIRSDDLDVYFALNQFEQRRAYKHMEAGLRRDVCHFYGDYASANSSALVSLMKIADTEAISKACEKAAELGLGWLEPGLSLTLHVSMVEQLPVVLRIYVGCAGVLYGDLDASDLVKIHIASGKVSFMRFDDFEAKPVPRMLERIKVKLREQDIQYFVYEGEYQPPNLYLKSRYINEEFDIWPSQKFFDDSLEALNLFDFSRYGPSLDLFSQVLSDHRWMIEDYRLVRSTGIPLLNQSCGQYLTYRDLIECGETWEVTKLDNCPRQPESYNALHDLCTQVLDPVIDYFGMIHLTYGFCSPALARKVPGRIAPDRDQHAAHELNRLKKPVCKRLGAAADFLVEDECMLEVAQWVVENTAFDRLYFYGKDRPVHVSHGPDNSRQVVMMLAGSGGKRVPRVVSVEKFLQVK
jgi:DNA phosphorothioation-associated putative methyltransferase